MTEDAARVVSLLRVPPRRRRHANAYCSLCGREQLNRPLAELKDREDCLCPGRCATAWRTLAMLRTRESGNSALATRRQLQWEAHQTQAISLSELLLKRWRAGDWGLEPRDVLARLS